MPPSRFTPSPTSGDSSRIRGDRADNLEKAIAASQAALTVFTREASPQDWAASQAILGIAFQKRVRGDRADNIEKAIGASEAALTVTTREVNPRDWAATQGILGIAYRDRIRGDRADNFEKAIAASEAALTVFTRAASPRDWALNQGALGSAYFGRIRGDRADNLEKALAFCEAALTVLTPQASPSDWAGMQNYLGISYFGRIRGNRAENLEKAIVAFERALTVRTRQALPRDWAETQHNLGSAYWKRIRGDRADNIEKAIAAFEGALTITTREVLPRDWARTQNNLGLAYLERTREDPASNRERAIAAYQQALTVFTREAMPFEWATAQYGLGLAFRERVRGDRTDNLRNATAATEAALEVFTRDALPYEHLRASLVLGKTRFEAREWRKASSAYASARDASLLLIGRGLNDAEARDLIGLAGDMFAEAAFAAAQRGQMKTALALSTEGRARQMAVALKLQTLELPADKRQRLDELRSLIRTAEHAVHVMQGTERAATVEQLGSLRRELLGLITNADGRTQATAFSQARTLAGQRGAVVVPIVTKSGSKLLIVTNAIASSRPDRIGQEDGTGAKGSDFQGLISIDLPELTTGKLDALMRGDGKDGKIAGWLGAYSINHLAGAEIDRRWPEWLAAVGELGPELWRILGARLDAALKESGVKPGARFVWLPTGALGILPLGLAQHPGTKRRLADSYEIVYAPSLEALTSARKQIAQSTPATLTAVVNPTGDLVGTEKEGKVVASYFPATARTVLERAQATPDAVLAALRGKTHWHFASHGTFSWVDARQSALVMHGRAPLSVARLLETDGLGQPRLVVLSACETGLYDIARSPDEFIGLPGTFMALGAAGVLGTLWPVNDTATALLMAKFYELHIGQHGKEQLSPPTALRRAQLWLRQATNADLQAYATAAAKQGRLEGNHAAEIAEELSEARLTRSRNAALIEWTEPERVRVPGETVLRGRDRVARPYAHPYFWAGFIYTGQ